ncbi:MAG: hypothetical protein IJ809_04990 [Clostridia bacterium]|nr:hypothetical protein [Clostridia bacterium]
MLQTLYDFWRFLGANEGLATLVCALGLLLFGMSDKKLEYKIEDEETGKKVKVYKYK